MEISFGCFDTLVANPKLCNLHAFFLGDSCDEDVPEAMIAYPFNFAFETR